MTGPLAAKPSTRGSLGPGSCRGKDFVPWDPGGWKGEAPAANAAPRAEGPCLRGSRSACAMNGLKGFAGEIRARVNEDVHARDEVRPHHPARLFGAPFKMMPADPPAVAVGSRTAQSA